jgi:hypothetical protein
VDNIIIDIIINHGFVTITTFDFLTFHFTHFRDRSVRLGTDGGSGGGKCFGTVVMSRHGGTC